MQCKVSLNEKLDRLRKLDEQILTLVKDDDIENEIEQADQFKERIQQAIFCLEYKISARESSVSPTEVPDTAPATSSATPVTSSAAPVTSSKHDSPPRIQHQLPIIKPQQLQTIVYQQ